MNAAEVLAAIRRHHHKAAIVHEVVVDDPGRGPGDAPQRRIDALMILNRQRTAIEIKVTRADYARETEAKRRAWQAICHRFVYATPSGLITPEEVPVGIGLWEIQDSSPYVRVVRRARVNSDPEPVPDQLFTAMCYRAMETARRRGRRR